MNALMPWSIERDGSALHVQITTPMTGEWEDLLDAVRANQEPVPYAIYLPSRIEGSSQLDSEMLTELWQALQNLGIMILPPPERPLA
jgi:hypothetical protein